MVSRTMLIRFGKKAERERLFTEITGTASSVDELIDKT